jgi:uncharacterized protein (DUF1330 family)
MASARPSPLAFVTQFAKYTPDLRLQRTVLIEFDSVAAAMAAHDSPAYAEALRVLGDNAVDRDIRIVEAAS